MPARRTWADIGFALLLALPAAAIPDTAPRSAPDSATATTPVQLAEVQPAAKLPG